MKYPRSGKPLNLRLRDPAARRRANEKPRQWRLAVLPGLLILALLLLLGAAPPDLEAVAKLPKSLWPHAGSRNALSADVGGAGAAARLESTPGGDAHTAGPGVRSRDADIGGGLVLGADLRGAQTPSLGTGGGSGTGSDPGGPGAPGSEPPPQSGSGLLPPLPVNLPSQLTGPVDGLLGTAGSTVTTVTSLASGLTSADGAVSSVLGGAGTTVQNLTGAVGGALGGAPVLDAAGNLLGSGGLATASGPQDVGPQSPSGSPVQLNLLAGLQPSDFGVVPPGGGASVSASAGASAGSAAQTVDDISSTALDVVNNDILGDAGAGGDVTSLDGGSLSDGLTSLTDGLGGTVDGLTTTLNDTLGGVGDTLGVNDTLGGVGDGVASLGDGLNGSVDGLNGTLDGLTGGLNDALGGLGGGQSGP